MCSSDLVTAMAQCLHIFVPVLEENRTPPRMKIVSISISTMCYRRLTSLDRDLKDGLAEQQNWGMSLPARSPLTDVGAKAARILDQAQAMADQLRAETRAEVLEILRRHEAERTAAEDLAEIGRAHV